MDDFHNSKVGVNREDNKSLLPPRGCNSVIQPELLIM